LSALGLVVLVLSGCVTDKVSEVASSVGDVFATGEAKAPTRVPIFVVSTRASKSGGPDDLSDGTSESLQTVTVPPGHKPGVIERPTFGAEDPKRHFTISAYRGLGEDDFKRELTEHFAGRAGADRDVLLYIHGLDTGYDEARYRLARLVIDGRFGGVPVLFTWPASGGLFDYEAVKQGASASRDRLARLFLVLGAIPDVGHIQIVAQSMGSWLTMEALRQDALAGHPDLDGKLGEVMLAAPDIDLGVFREQLAKIDPARVSVLVLANDRALSISRRLAGDRPRVGALNPRDPKDAGLLDSLGVNVYDLARHAGDAGDRKIDAAPRIVREIGARIGETEAAEADARAALDARSGDTKVVTQPLPPTPTVNAPPLVPETAK
jgi:esterase/lipase superfamily enzyme